MFISRKLMVIVVMVGSIHAASADKASDAVQVLLKLWEASLDASYCADWKILKTEFVGDVKCTKCVSSFALRMEKLHCRYVCGLKTRNRPVPPCCKKWILVTDITSKSGFL
jgi:hypothetical protein